MERVVGMGVRAMDEVEDEMEDVADACSLLRCNGYTPPGRVTRSIVAARDTTEAMLWEMQGARLSHEEWEELALHAEALAQLAEEMRAIVRGERPPVGF
jgi:hypothetical protein